MSQPAERRASRREALRAVARWAALGGLGVAGGTLIARGRNAQDDGACAKPRGCQQCPALRECGLPQAAPARLAMTKEGP